MPLGVECGTTLSAATTPSALPSVKSLASGSTFYPVMISDHFFGLKQLVYCHLQVNRARGQEKSLMVVGPVKWKIGLS